MRTAADLGYLRGYNDALVMAVARHAEEFDRATVTEATGLTPQAVSKVIARLIAAGPVTEAGHRRRGVGKPTTVYRLVPDSRHAVGAQVGRRTLTMVRTDLTGAVRDRTFCPLPADYTPERLLDELERGFAELQRGFDTMRERDPDAAGTIVGVGIAMVGPLDHKLGVIRDAHQLRHWHDVPLRDLAAQRLGLPVIVDKDTTAAVIAEAWRRGPGFRDAALIMVEDGVGVGLWLDGQAFRGAHTNAGEFGHTVIDLNGAKCVCGRSGCVEITHDRAVARGDLTGAARVLGSAVVNLIQTVDVRHVVLAGAGIARAEELYADAVRAAIRTELPRSDWLAVEVATAELGADFAAAGAAMEVLNAFYGTPTPMSAQREHAGRT